MKAPNLNYIKALADGDENFEKGFLKTIIVELNKDMKTYSDALTKSDTQNMSLIVHKICNKIAIFELEKGLKLARTYEENLKNNNTELHSKFNAIINKITLFINQNT